LTLAGEQTLLRMFHDTGWLPVLQLPLVWNGAPGPQAEPFGRPTPNPAPRAGKSLPPDGLGNWPREAATSPKPLSVLAFLTQ
ncbi:MAG TPA: hypothetical protein PKX75_19075, partial [Nitrospira sp.]|nr:hypothetical protein [Nitrospira sp.]HNK51149.1 hypothetical protein [Nitrospira sp.]